MTHAEGKTAIVTGAAQGIGRSIAERLLRNGYNIFAIDLNQVELAKLQDSWEGRVETRAADVADRTLPCDVIAACLARFSRLDVLVNNAGIGHGTPISETTDEQLDRHFDVNFKSVFRFSREALKVMHSGASIIHISSIFGMRGFPNNSAYAASKAAIIGLTREMAAEVGPSGIRVNAVAPGITCTPATRERIDTSDAFRKKHDGCSTFSAHRTT